MYVYNILMGNFQDEDHISDVTPGPERQINEVEVGDSKDHQCSHDPCKISLDKGQEIITSHNKDAMSLLFTFLLRYNWHSTVY